LASADWFEDPDAIHPGEWLTCGARPEEIRAAYQQFGARFELDHDGTLTLRLNLDLDTHNPLHYERTYTATSTGSSARTAS
jgi:hypothetical protein